MYILSQLLLDVLLMITFLIKMFSIFNLFHLWVLGFEIFLFNLSLSLNFKKKVYIFYSMKVMALKYFCVRCEIIVYFSFSS